jgi:GT2 family glycosyltransferase
MNKGNSMSSVSVIILNFKKYNKTYDCLSSIKSNSNISNIIVVDNDVLTEDFIDLKSQFKKDKNIFFISTNQNLGYANGNNFGINWANSLGILADYIAIVNNDIIVTNKDIFHDLLISYKLNSNVGVISPKIIHKRTGNQQGPYKKEFIIFNFLESILPIFIFTRIMLERYIRNKDFNTKKVYRTMGSFFLIKSSIFKKIGLFDNNTFLGSEEEILSEKLKQFNLNFYHYPNQFVLHDHGATTSSENSSLMHKYFLESKIYYFKKYRKSSSFAILFLKIAENIKYLLKKFINI